jgi:nitrogen-specific signal transduction histidine kinase/CheY-like chemotaxis protein
MMSVYADYDQTGALHGFDGYLVDITEKKQLEEALIQTQKLESLGLLAGGIAHDFNNILTGILGYAEVLQWENTGQDVVVKYAKIIEKSALRAAALTQQLLGFARKGKLKVEPLDVNQITSELVHFLKETFDRSIVVVLNTDKDLPPVLGDGTQVYQALMNLCINARDAMPKGGRLSVKTELCALTNEKVHEHFHIPPGDYVQISVTDTGTGMTPEVKRRIFEPFYTTKEVGKGTGLGLSMAYGIAKNHGGYINAYSEPGLGTTMRIYLPAMRTDMPAQAAAERQAGIHRVATILLIDDEAVVRDLAKGVLESHSYEVLSAANGAEGVKVFREKKDAIDLVLLDMVMPEKNGAQVFKEIRAMRPEVKVLLCSGYDEEEYFQELFKLGAVGFVQKPFRFTELLRQVDKAIGEEQSAAT